MQAEMIFEKGIYLRSRRRKLCNIKSIMCLVIFITTFLISTTEAIKCYVCGKDDSELFLDSPNINKTYIQEHSHKSCDDFDRIPLEEKYKYEMECPEKYLGCMLEVGATVVRSCTQFGIDDCKTANKVHFCYCNRNLCNGENAESVNEKFGDVHDEDEDDEEEFEDDEYSGSEDQDDEDFDLRVTSRRNEVPETSTTEGNKLPVITVSTEATAKPSVNKAVTANLSRNLLIFILLARLLIVCRHN